MDLKRHNQEILISSLVSSSAVWNIFPLCHWVTVRKITVNVRSKSTLATSCEELTHWKRFWCWEGLGAGGEVDDRGWDGWIVSLTRWTQIWVNSGSWWWTGRPGVLRFMGSQRVGHKWATELKWTETLVCSGNRRRFSVLLVYWFGFQTGFPSDLQTSW